MAEKSKAAPKPPKAPATPVASKAAKPAKPAKEAKPKVERVKANGITRPKDNCTCGKLFEIADKISASTKKPARRAAVLEAAAKLSINPATAATQYGRWRRFNGLKGRDEPEEKGAAAAK